MKSLPKFSVENPVLINLFMVTVLVGGVFSVLTIVREMFPESRPNQILITTAYPGATPAEVEKGVTLKIEEQIKDVDGVETVRANISEGRSNILVELHSGYAEFDQAINDIKSAIDAIPPDDFPEDALETQVAKFEPQFPVIMVSLFGDLDDRMLKTFGERLRNDLLALPGVTKVALSGTRDDEISIDVRPDKLVEFGLSFMDVAEAVAASDIDLPGGEVRTSRVNVAVRTLGERTHADDLRDIVVRSDVAGRTVRLADVANIVDGFEDASVSGRFLGKPAIDVRVSKTPEQDAIAIATLVRAMVAGKMGWPLHMSWSDRALEWLPGRAGPRAVYKQAQSDPYPPGIGLETHNDLSRFIEGRLNLLIRNGAWGLVLVFLSLLVFLHWRVAFWVMMGLILAIAGSLIAMKLLGQTLNLITMFGLIIVLGLLVDDAIIVSEHVYSKMEDGLTPQRSAVLGTEAVTWPVVCAIVTTIVAFVPLMFIEGQMGDWMGVLPVVVCVALTVSLFEALTILPCHLAHGLRAIVPTKTKTPQRGRLGAMLARLRGGKQGAFLNMLKRYYERLVRLATSYRYVTMSALAACMLVVVGGVVGGHVPWVFIQKIDSDLIIANLRMSVGTPADATREAVRVIDEAALDVDELLTLYSLVGTQFTDDGSASVLQSHLGQSFIELQSSDPRDAESEGARNAVSSGRRPYQTRTRNSDAIVAQLRAATMDIPGVEKLRFTTLSGGPGGAAIHIEVRGDRVDDLVAVSDEVKRALGEFGGVYDIVDDFDAGRPEVQIELFDSARALGLTTQSLATQVRAGFYGFEAKKVQRGREDVKIMVRYPPEYRKRIYDIESMYVATPTGDLVPFGEVARLTEDTGFASIKRVDQRRTITVTADVDTHISNADLIMGTLALRFPEWQRRFPGVGLKFGGQKLETTKSFGSLKYSFAIALLLIYVILAGLFRSYVQPMIVMAVIPFGLIGAVAGHFIMGYPLTLLSTIGLVALAGIVVNDSMILVTFINKLVADGAPVEEAVIRGGLGRLRPILLTSATTVMGIAPLLTETSFQAKFLIPMGISISAGLILATVLTLIAVPSMYLIVLDVKHTALASAAWLLGRTPSETA